jgi:hypothetical protein
MNKWILPIGLFLCMIALGVGTVFAMKRDEFSNVKNEADCNDRTKLPASCQKDPECCTIWSSGLCRKGRVDGGKCVSKGDLVPFSLGVLCIMSLIAFIVYTVKAFRA